MKIMVLLCAQKLMIPRKGEFGILNGRPGKMSTLYIARMVGVKLG